MDDYDGDIYAGTDQSNPDVLDNADDLRAESVDTTRARLAAEKAGITHLDWTRCPCCGNVDDFAISTDERVYSSSGVEISLNAEGVLQAAKLHSQEVSYKSAKVVGYYADCCGETLPDPYQDFLDWALDITRKD